VVGEVRPGSRGWRGGERLGNSEAQLYSCQSGRRSMAGQKNGSGRAEKSMHGMGAGNEVTVAERIFLGRRCSRSQGRASYRKMQLLATKVQEAHAHG
jgi:hypothetical protein